MGTGISCTQSSEVAGLIYRTGRSTLAIVSPCAAVLQTHTAEIESGPENKLVLESLMKQIYLLHRWLDKLGIAALTNHTRVFRQAFVGGHYSLLDSDQNPLPVSPNPDIAISVLVVRKRLAC